MEEHKPETQQSSDLVKEFPAKNLANMEINHFISVLERF